MGSCIKLTLCLRECTILSGREGRGGEGRVDKQEGAPRKLIA